tara:strand:- start:580 stop:1716 length:1137 start_codon:yes stop_codon:yes gene_type:complete
MQNKVTIDDGLKRDIINIATKAYTPILGFLKEKDLDSVVKNMRLTSGEIWSIPIVLNLSKEDYEYHKQQNELYLQDVEGYRIAKIINPEFYKYDKFVLCEKIYGTKDINHPGVNKVMNSGEFFVGGDIEIDSKFNDKIHEYHFTPDEIIAEKNSRNWKTMVAFQTRNIPHRSHEFLQKEALKVADGLLVQPVIGKKKQGDFDDDLIIKSYQVLFRHYHDESRAILGLLPLEMRYAGPREAVHHAVVRKNHGCTHMIIGRDHAGVGDYYDPFAAQNIFDQFTAGELGIKILKFDNAHFCTECDDIVFSSNHQHNVDPEYNVSGTKLREMVKNKQALPKYIVRPEIADIIINYPNPLVWIKITKDWLFGLQVFLEQEKQL